MGKDHKESSKKAAHWLELKTAWTRWLNGDRRHDLSAEARAYFENLAHRHLLHSLEVGGRLFERVPRPADAAESWSIVLTHLVEKRRQASLAILDDIFERAERRAREHTGDSSSWDTLEEMIGWIQNQFAMRVRDVARAYARTFGTCEELKVTISGDAPASNTPSDDARTQSVFDRVSGGAEWGNETERRELDEVGTRIGADHFTSLRAAARLGVFLRCMRMRRAIIISSEEPEVAAVAGVKKAVFAQLAKDAHEALAPKLRELDEWSDVDAEPGTILGLAAIRSLWDVAEEWLWSGAWLDELPPRQKGGSPNGHAASAHDFISLVRRRMAEFFPENELAGLFKSTEARLKTQVSSTNTLS